MIANLDFIKMNDAERLEWQFQIGQAMLRFADIEYATLIFIAHFPSGKNINFAPKLPFRERTKLIEEMLLSMPRASKESNELRDLFKRANELAIDRNAIAHNPLLLEVCAQEKSGDIAFSNAIAISRGSRSSIDLAELKEISAAIDDVAGELYLALSKFLNLGLNSILVKKR